jgi:hypothetical protein
MLVPTGRTLTFEPWFAKTPAADPEDLRMAWRDACADLRVAYHEWRQQGEDRAARGDAFAAYVAAADREAAAAEALARRAATA